MPLGHNLGKLCSILHSGQARLGSRSSSAVKTSFWNIAALLIAFTLVAQMIIPSVPAYGADSPATVSDKPQITTGPFADTSSAGARIAWSTGERTHMGVRFGTDPAHLDQIVGAVEQGGGRIHYVSLHGLNPDTEYFFQVATQSNNGIGSIGVFRTLPAKSTTVRPHRRPPPVGGR
jgi:hypothetical protein